MMRHADELQLGLNAALCLIGISQVGKAMNRIACGGSCNCLEGDFMKRVDRELLGCLCMTWGMFGFSTYVDISKTSAVIRARHGDEREDLVAEEIRRHRDRKYSDMSGLVGTTTVLAVIFQGIARVLAIGPG
jgi:hypothetical protein